MDWKVREARSLSDIQAIGVLAAGSSEFLMPYVLNPFVLSKYIDQFLVAEDEEGKIGGALHLLEGMSQRNYFFLLHVKGVPANLSRDFLVKSSTKKNAFIGQVICPAKGSFYSILQKAKSIYEEIYCWMSLKGPSYGSYKRYGFVFDLSTEREIWNIYKCCTSNFCLGTWSKLEEQGRLIE
jgi:hypothetical protein